MHRRKFIQNMALLSLMSPFIKVNASTNKKIVVVGAGIIGASIAYELSKHRRAATEITLQKVKGMLPR